jgi:hypothetical protein
VGPVQPDDEAALLDFYLVGSSDDSKFDKVFFANAEAEAAEEAAQCGAEEQFQGDLQYAEQEAILSSFNSKRCWGSMIKCSRRPTTPTSCMPCRSHASERPRRRQAAT